MLLGKEAEKTTTSDAEQQQQVLIEREQAIFSDVLQEDFLDTYNNLTLKSLFTLKYFNSLPQRKGKNLIWIRCYV